MTRTKIASKRRQRQTALVPKKQTPTLADLLDRPKLDLEKADIALLNLLCAVGLPGAENLDIPRLLGKLDEWAKLVRLETDRNYYKFLNSPGRFNNSQACFCVVCMISVLQDNCGVRYDPKWKGRLTPENPCRWNLALTPKTSSFMLSSTVPAGRAARCRCCTPPLDDAWGIR